MTLRAQMTRGSFAYFNPFCFHCFYFHFFFYFYFYFMFISIFILFFIFIFYVLFLFFVGNLMLLLFKNKLHEIMMIILCNLASQFCLTSSFCQGRSDKIVQYYHFHYLQSFCLGKDQSLCDILIGREID